MKTLKLTLLFLLLLPTLAIADVRCPYPSEIQVHFMPLGYRWWSAEVDGITYYQDHPPQELDPASLDFCYARLEGQSVHCAYKTSGYKKIVLTNKGDTYPDTNFTMPAPSGCPDYEAGECCWGSENQCSFYFWE